MRTMFRILAIALALPLAFSSAAKDAGDITDYVGTWQTAGTTDVILTTSASSPQLKLVLPPSMKLPNGQTTILLAHTDASIFSSVDKSGIVVQFTLKSRGHAEYTMKAHRPGVWTYLDTDLTRR